MSLSSFCSSSATVLFLALLHAHSKTCSLHLRNGRYWLLIRVICVEVKTTWMLPFKELFLLCYPSRSNHNCLHWEGRAGSGFGGGIFDHCAHTHTRTHTLASWISLNVLVRAKRQKKKTQWDLSCSRAPELFKAANAVLKLWNFLLAEKDDGRPYVYSLSSVEKGCVYVAVGMWWHQRGSLWE